jgi:hypothetical protein
MEEWKNGRMGEWKEMEECKEMGECKNERMEE